MLIGGVERNSFDGKLYCQGECLNNEENKVIETQEMRIAKLKQIIRRQNKIIVKLKGETK